MVSKVLIIVLNWNGYSDTTECVKSLQEITYPEYEILLVDNGSTDGSEKILREKFPKLSLIQTGENLGYAQGNNIGIQYALDKGAEYIVLINNDTIVDPEFVTELVQVAVKDPLIGILSSKIYFYKNPNVLWFAGATFNLKTGWSKHKGYNERDTGQHDEIKEIDRACGCAMMVSKKVCKAVGLMNPDYFCYGEEVDWSIRAKKAGFKVAFVPKSKVWHKVSGSTGGAKSGNYIYYALRNTLKCLNDNEPYKYKMQNLIREVFVIVLFVGSLFTLKIPKTIGIKKIYQGASDYYLCRFGKQISQNDHRF